MRSTGVNAEGGSDAHSGFGDRDGLDWAGRSPDVRSGLSGLSAGIRPGNLLRMPLHVAAPMQRNSSRPFSTVRRQSIFRRRASAAKRSLLERTTSAAERLAPRSRQPAGDGPAIASRRLESKRAALARPLPVKFVGNEKQPRQDTFYRFPQARVSGRIRLQTGVPELTGNADIKLNKRLSLRPT